ncbi:MULTISPECIES: ammonium transporter [Pseudomonadaceae]|uniref:Ammonium transporter n=1 Tax=Pseudomonas oryzihabitans TaxID=47885 RepID=A0A1G5NSS7_9PSED|nr:MULTISPECIES: ammonium transporter [Pseudomonas]HCV76265.1 ammonium transporter [Pseudomonas sp.]KIZ49988.1 ammonia channel protein [Pseudomonas oryzihabitans]MBA1260152.1 ammonium transporter [Pseudomonas psychrotolerans]MBH3332189.1 ammonium transporter [Pseudomonas oryzihabitans]MDK4198816.1 ammonium transporter [Pseudomonas sp. HR1]
MTLRTYAGLGALMSFVALPGLAMAQEAAAAPAINSGDTAWMLVSTALVLFMTIPGLALFYGGMVRAKNVLSVMMQCFAITGLVSILWMVYGYSLAFDTTGMEKGVTNFNSFIGGLGKAFLSSLQHDAVTSATALFPESVFVTFQMTFAIITPALIVGAFAERMKFSAMLVFTGLWFTFVYAPIAHMVWSGDGGLMWDWGVLDFAGGTVVHINAGVAGLVAALVLGKRKGYPTTPMAPHNLGYTLVGAAMLWVGWFGFNAGSAAAANGTAGMAMLTTQIATAAAALGWMFAEWITHGKPSALGIASGVVAGLVAITPAAGTAGPMGALIIGLAAGVICFFTATSLKRKLGYDDSLDAFGVHGIGGIVGALLTGVFAAPSLGGFGTVTDIGAQLFIQFKGVAFTIVYTGIVTFVILKVLDVVMGLRVNEEEETVGLDLTLHNERGYNL